MVADSKKTLRGKGQKLKQMHLVCLLQSMLSAVLHILSGVVYHVHCIAEIARTVCRHFGSGQRPIRDPQVFRIV